MQHLQKTRGVAMVKPHSLFFNSPPIQAQYGAPIQGEFMKRRLALASFLCACLSLAPFGTHVIADEQPLFGYSAESSRAERQWEEKLRAIPSTANLRAY